MNHYHVYEETTEKMFGTKGEWKVVQCDCGQQRIITKVYSQQQPGGYIKFDARNRAEANQYIA